MFYNGSAVATNSTVTESLNNKSNGRIKNTTNNLVDSDSNHSDTVSVESYIGITGATTNEKDDGEDRKIPVFNSKKEEALDRLAHAVAVAETSNCTKGYAITHNNCHGIKKGNTYPCKLKPGSKSRMCNFATKEESFKAFKIIWGKWYHNPPTLRDAGVWTGHDNAYTWLKNVKSNL